MKENPMAPGNRTILHILNFGRTWTVKLDCGCNRRGLTSDEIEREQLYVGKRVDCQKHSTE